MLFPRGACVGVIAGGLGWLGWERCSGEKGARGERPELAAPLQRLERREMGNHKYSVSMDPLLSDSTLVDSSPEGSLESFDLEQGPGARLRALKRAGQANPWVSQIMRILPTRLAQLSTRKALAAAAVILLCLIGLSSRSGSGRTTPIARRPVQAWGLGGPQGVVEPPIQRVIPSRELLTDKAPALSLYDGLRPELRYLTCDSWSGLSECLGQAHGCFGPC